MKNKIQGIAWAVSLCAILSLSACGGGGSGSNSGYGESSTPTSSAAPVGSWQSQRVGTWTDNIFPGNTYQPIGGEPPYALWLSNLVDGKVSLNQTVAAHGARGLSTTSLQSELPREAQSNATVAVTSGAWSLIAWTESSVWTSSYGGAGLYVRLKGPDMDSGAIQISSTFQGTGWEVSLALDANGNARAYWDEKYQSGVPFRFGVNGRFEGGRWVQQSDTGISLSGRQRYLVGPDGQGWVFTAPFVDGAYKHELRRLTAVGGLGEVVRLDETGSAWGASNGFRLASAEGDASFTTVGYQQTSEGIGCLTVRRMVNGVLKGTECIVAAAEGRPNLNYLALASAPTGQASLVWSVGTQDSALYVARRTANGGWSPAAKLVDLPRPGGSSSLSGLKMEMGPTGDTLVVYRAHLMEFDVAKVYAMVAKDGSIWSEPAPLAYSEHSNFEVALAFNGQGLPGVLQLTIGYLPSTRTYPSAVLMSTWVNGKWVSTPLATDIRLAYINSTPLSQVRLAPQGDSGWLAMWDQGNGPGDESGYRELWLSEYR